MGSWGKRTRGRAGVAGATWVPTRTSVPVTVADMPVKRSLRTKTKLARSVRIAAAIFATGGVAMATSCASGSHTAKAVSSGTAASSASATSTSASTTAWDPCSIPDADITAAGLDPSTKQANGLGIKFPGWDICGWNSNSWYELDVYSTNSHTYDEVVHNTTLFHDPQPVTVAGRAGTILPHVGESDACTVAFDAVDPIQIDVSAMVTADKTGDPCAEATRISGVLMKDLPAAK